MRNSLIILFITFAAHASAQKIIKIEPVTDHAIHIIGNDFQGIIFKGEYKVLYPVYDTIEYKKNTWFTPTPEEILIAEKVLRTQLKKSDKKSKYQFRKIVYNQLNKDFRQYVGYILPTGEKVIYINGFPNDEEWAIVSEKSSKKQLNIPKWYNNLFEVLDGGSAFWHIEVNFNNKKDNFIRS